MPVAFVIGGAECVIDDYMSARSLVEPDAYFVVNDMIGTWTERLDYAITLHPEKICDWLAQRRLWVESSDFEVVGPMLKPIEQQFAKYFTMLVEDCAGSSGLFAVAVAVLEGFERIILCGVPMTISGKHFLRHTAWTDRSLFVGAWEVNLHRFSPYTRSMSGWTKEKLGAPTAEWLKHRSA
jgi:hypothetical protein